MPDPCLGWLIRYAIPAAWAIPTRDRPILSNSPTRWVAAPAARERPSVALAHELCLRVGLADHEDAVLASEADVDAHLELACHLELGRAAEHPLGDT